MSMPSIGFIGAGMMGAGMAGRLLSAGHRVGGLSHQNREPVEILVQRGAVEVFDVIALVNAFDVLITCLPNADIVEELAGVIVPNLRDGQFWIDTTTSRPQTSERIAADVSAHGAIFADAPVTGGPQQAQDGALASLVGCSEEHFSALERIIGTYSKIVRRFGAPGRGHAAKLLNNLVTQGTMVLLADAFHAADRYGIDAHTLYDIMLSGAARSGTLEKAVGPALSGDFGGSQFSIANASKDMGYAHDLLCEIAKNQTNIAESLSARLAAHVGNGHGSKFVSAMLDPQFC